MKRLPRILVASASVGLILTVAVTGIALAPEGAERWLFLSALVAVIAAIQGVATDPADLAAALLFSLPPVLALLTEGSPTWLIGPLGALLLLAAELSALSWECQGDNPLTTLTGRRLIGIAGLALVGLVAALVVGSVAPRVSLGGTAAVAVAAVALAAIGGAVFPGQRVTRGHPDPSNGEYGTRSE